MNLSTMPGTSSVNDQKFRVVEPLPLPLLLASEDADEASPFEEAGVSLDEPCAPHDAKEAIIASAAIDDNTFFILITSNIIFLYQCYLERELETEENVINDRLQHFLTAACKRSCDLALFKSILFEVCHIDLAVDDILTDTCCP